MADAPVGLHGDCDAEMSYQSLLSTLDEQAAQSWLNAVPEAAQSPTTPLPEADLLVDAFEARDEAAHAGVACHALQKTVDKVTKPAAKEVSFTLPLNLSFDVSGAKMGASAGPYQFANIQKVAPKIEQVWQQLRIQQENTWVTTGVPDEIEKYVRDHKKGTKRLIELKEILAEAARGNREPLIKRHQQMKKHKAMRVVKLEKTKGVLLTPLDLENCCEDMWVRLVCRLSGDPLLRDLSCDGGRTNYVMVLIMYEKYLNHDPSKEEQPTRELRFARLSAHDYAMVFPVLPYPGCKLRRPTDCLSLHFPVDSNLALANKFADNIFAAQATLAWLFWECFNIAFPETDRNKSLDLDMETHKARRCCPRTKRLLGGPRHLKDCHTRMEALSVVWSLMRIESFQLPFHKKETVDITDGSDMLPEGASQEQADAARLLRAVEKAFAGGANEVEEAKAVLPRSWANVPKGARWPLEIQPPFGWEDIQGLVKDVEPLVPQLGGKRELKLAVVHCLAVLRERPSESSGLAGQERLGGEVVAQVPEAKIKVHRSNTISRLRSVTKTVIGHLAKNRRAARELAESDDKIEEQSEDGAVEDHCLEEDEDMREERRIISLIVDRARWESDRELTVMDINTNNCWEMMGVLAVARQLEHYSSAARLPKEQREDFKQKVAQLAYGLQALQRADVKQELRDVGLAVTEMERTERGTLAAGRRLLPWAIDKMRPRRVSAAGASMREAWSTDASHGESKQRVLLISAPNNVLEQRAQKLRFISKVLPKASGRYLGGFDAKQFDRGAPTETFWLQTPNNRYHYKPYFAPAIPETDPAAILSPSERKYIVRSFITDPISEARFPDGSLDPRQGGADMDPRSLIQNGIIDDFLPLSSRWATAMMLVEQSLPWRKHGWLRFFKQDLFTVRADLALTHFGPRLASFFCFMQAYAVWLVLPTVLGIIAMCAGNPGTSHGVWRYVRPIFGIFMPLWGTVFSILWRRHLMSLAHRWQNGWMQMGDEFGRGDMLEELQRVRPEFAAQFRKQFENGSPANQHKTLESLWDVLRVLEDSAKGVDNAVMEARKAAFSEKALRKDIDHFDSACFIPPKKKWHRDIVSTAASALMVALCCAATVVNLILSEVLPTSYASVVAAIWSVVIISLLDMVNREIAIRTTDWQGFRQDRQYEGTLFLKLFVFAFFNNFNSLFAIAFWNRNMDQLQIQVLFLVFSLTFKGNLVELLLPVVQKCVAQVAQVVNGEAESREKGQVSRGGEGSNPEHEMREYLDDQLARGTEFIIVDEEIEVAILHGMVLMFSISFPLAPLIVLIGTFQEIRLDSYKLVQLQRCPEPRMLTGVGMTYLAILMLTCMSLFFNGALLFATLYGCSNAGKCWDPSWSETLVGAQSGLDILLGDVNQARQMVCVFGVEHAMLILMYLLLQTAPVSNQVKLEQYRQSYFENRVAFRYMESQENTGIRKVLQRRARHARNAGLEPGDKPDGQLEWHSE